MAIVHQDDDEDCGVVSALLKEADALIESASAAGSRVGDGKSYDAISMLACAITSVCARQPTLDACADVVTRVVDLFEPREFTAIVSRARLMLQEPPVAAAVMEGRA